MPGLGYVQASCLQPGMEVFTADRSTKVVTSVTVEKPKKPTTVYNLNVSGNHNYYVGSGVLVHNNCEDGGIEVSQTSPVSQGSEGESGRTTSENSTILGNNLAREGRAVGEGEAAAHIVASTGSKRQWEAASSSRELLAKYDIDINDAANGIPLGHPRPHNLTHTRAFHEMVNNRLYTVESNMLSKGYGRKAIRSSLRRELRAIGKEFESGIGN